MELDELTYTVPSGIVRHLITGLTPGGNYEFAIQNDRDELIVTIRPGGLRFADLGGVLSLDVR